MTNALRSVASAILLVAAAAFPLLPANAQQVPPNLEPPANEQAVVQVHAKGDQIYICQEGATQIAWDLKSSEAQLFDNSGNLFGKHYAGPAWEATDGSRVTGKIVAVAPSPDPASIPWLLLTVVSRSGEGVLSRATSIQRINTKGGKAPASGCDPAHTGQELRVAYSADYVFFAPRTTHP